MLISSFQRTALMLAVTVVAATGCGGSGTGAPTAVSPPITANGAASTASTLNVSGGFAGNVQDSVFGRGRIYAELAQYQNAVGGILTFVYGSTVFITPATFLLSGRTLTGSGAIGKVTGGVCTASEMATYTASHHLNGSYSATNGCSGDTGAFTMKQTCRYAQGSVAGVNFGLKRC
jgi:hypothetical protein